MSDLIPSYSLSSFKALRADQIKRLKSCELTVDGEYLCTVISPTTDYIKVQTEYLGQLSNSVGKELMEEILNESTVSI